MVFWHTPISPLNKVWHCPTCGRLTVHTIRPIQHLKAGYEIDGDGPTTNDYVHCDGKLQEVDRPDVMAAYLVGGQVAVYRMSEPLDET